MPSKTEKSKQDPKRSDPPPDLEKDPTDRREQAAVITDASGNVKARIG
jgi:hypothetical protein